MLRLRANQRGQVALEYAMAILIVIALTSLLWVFYQGFVQGNLYGGGERGQNQFFGLSGDDKAMGLEEVASLPFP